MFKSTLTAQIKSIFEIDRISYDLPGESKEQEGLFIDVSTVQARVKDGRAVARVTGVIRVFAVSGKLPYGFFVKKIDGADPADKDGLYFYNFEENKGTYRNIIERSVGFQYFFDSQYNPAIGTIESVDLTMETDQ